MPNGWIKLHRKLLDNPIFQNPKLLTFWIYCLLKATHKKTKVMMGYKEIELEPGQFIFGRLKASEETGLSERSIRTCINTLKTTSNLTIKSTNKYSIANIINWDTYQSKELENDQQNDQQSDKQTTSKRPASDHIQEVKECKEVKEDKKKEYSFDSKEIELSNLLLTKILERKPDFKKPNIQSWAKEIDLMIRIDKRNPDRIKTVINWCQEDSFWQNNILSTSKLKEQFDKLELKMEGIKSAKSRSGGLTLSDEEAKEKYGNIKQTIITDND